MIQTQTEAKRFFADRVVRQANAEGLELSDAERAMLLWSESDPEFEADSGLADALASQLSDEEYEKKISGLLARGLAADLAANSGAKDEWQQAQAVLKTGDHYLSIMVDRAVGSRVKRWWQF